MTNFQLYVIGRVAIKVVTVGVVIAVVRAATPMRRINDDIIRLRAEWKDSKLHASINERYAIGKLDRNGWLEAMHNGPAKLLWVNLSTAYPGHIRFIAKRIKEEYPHATKWI